MNRAALLTRPRLTAALVLSVCLVAGGWGAWTASLARTRNAVATWVDAQRAQGAHITFEEERAFGFPRRITLRLTHPRWTSADGLAFQAESLDIVANPWNWASFEIKLKTPARLAAPLDDDGYALRLDLQEGRARIASDGQGGWRAIDMTLHTVQTGLAPAYLFAAKEIVAQITKPDSAPRSYKEPSLLVTVDAKDLRVPEAMPAPFGREASAFSMRLRVMGAMPDLRRRATVVQWNEASGVIEFDDFSLDWGELKLATKGTMGFDGDLQPQGAFAGTIERPATALDVLKKQGFIARQDEALIASTLKLFAKPSTEEAKDGTVPLTLQMGGLFLGPIRLFTFPEIEWPIEPPAKGPSSSAP